MCTLFLHGFPAQLLGVSGPSAVISCAAAMWPLLLEQKNHQRPFLRALRAYAGFVFHPTLLLADSTPHQDILDMQWKVRVHDESQVGRFQCFCCSVRTTILSWATPRSKSTTSSWTTCSACGRGRWVWPLLPSCCLAP